MELSEILKHASEDVREANKDLLEYWPLPQAPAVPATKLEDKFARLWGSVPGAPELTREHKFHPMRRWRFDFAHQESKTAIEIEGGLWQNGRHNRAQGYIADCEKYNMAVLHGWSIFRLPAEMLNYSEVAAITAYIARTMDEQAARAR